MLTDRIEFCKLTILLLKYLIRNFLDWLWDVIELVCVDWSVLVWSDWEHNIAYNTSVLSLKIIFIFFVVFILFIHH